MHTYKKDERITPFIKEIIYLENDENSEVSLPFYADGYPGILFSETHEPICLLPEEKLLPDFFLYGQTIEPIQLQIFGAYKIIVFQLYPFATRLLINESPKTLNDKCYDLDQVKGVNAKKTTQRLINKGTEERIEVISDYILSLVKNSSVDPDNSIKLAVSTLINSKGMISIKQLREQLFITERTFERRFSKEIGVTPKQFAKIIQFSFSLNQIKTSDYTKLTNIAYDNGFTDQSHFIKTFKKYTGGTPKEILGKL